MCRWVAYAGPEIFLELEQATLALTPTKGELSTQS